MASRALLRQHITSAWHATMQEVYPEQLINSERGLQVYFCHRLLEQFEQEGVQRRIFVEPCFRKDGNRVSPDLVICHTRQIIGVIELKYLPRVRPLYEKDFDTLGWFAEHQDLTLSNERYLGSQARPGKSYTLAPDAVLCWAGIYRGPLDETIATEAAKRPIAPRFLGLHAVTSPGKDPELHPAPIVEPSQGAMD